jgi:hypothetical protein
MKKKNDRRMKKNERRVKNACFSTRGLGTLVPSSRELKLTHRDSAPRVQLKAVGLLFITSRRRDIVSGQNDAIAIALIFVESVLHTDRVIVSRLTLQISDNF